MIEMKPSPKFYQFSLQYIQDIHLRHNPIGQIIEDTLCVFRGDERGHVRRFTSDVLDAQLTEEQLHQLWASTPSDISFVDAEGLKTMLRAASDRL